MVKMVKSDNPGVAKEADEYFRDNPDKNPEVSVAGPLLLSSLMRHLSEASSQAWCGG